ncbi:hypothetical protein KKR91_07980 [Arthrobacter jiangjiafuii]|uniref:RHS repeat-associated core domain-containing protein n=1 Tax=Arthrobacter jiangjiafuii TaxID=2817475 RepID=A0A975M7P1_9MICC|nr:hypothetical protein [Arthrobacter jiangjiafuii]QWC11470.1 hypothetical protein KKR91_07980 [Arthrobacter jiangjiafuii]
MKTVRNPRLGEARFTHDAVGRLTAVTAGELVQEWAYRYGYLSEHTRIDRADPEASADITLIGRAEDGRIIGLTRAGAVTRYGYDGAGQLVAGATTPLGKTGAAATDRAQVSEWEYDAGGRLVREYTPAGPRTYAYDAAGQLLSAADADGSRTEYVYDGLGRRSRLIGADGAWTEYAWGETGYLQGTVDRTPDGAETARHELWVDFLGELASVDGCPLWWDSASGIPSLTGIGNEQVLNLPGCVTGIGEAWIAPGWRAARPTDETDPWPALGASVIPEPGVVSGMGAGSGSGVSSGSLPARISLTGNGGLDVAGLEWLGARAYDPTARGFLSTDPLAPVLGAGWDGNPYAYAGNNPLNASDPTGLRPLTDEELKAYDGARRGMLAAAGDWVKDNWEYVVGGVAIVGGAALMFVPGGQLVGAGLISFGADVVIQKATTGEVNWTQAGVSGGLGMLGFGAGAMAGKLLTNPAARAAVTNGVDGAVSGAGGYFTGPVRILLPGS